MAKCVFDTETDGCVALTEKKCEGCKFRKTKHEYAVAQTEAAQSLERRGLTVTSKRDENGSIIISTEATKCEP